MAGRVTSRRVACQLGHRRGAAVGLGILLEQTNIGDCSSASPVIARRTVCTWTDQGAQLARGPRRPRRVMGGINHVNAPSITIAAARTDCSARSDSLIARTDSADGERRRRVCRMHVRRPTGTCSRHVVDRGMETCKGSTVITRLGLCSPRQGV